jgi:hypothetical protein
MSKNKICEADVKRLEQGLDSIYRGKVDPKYLKRAKSLYFRYLVDGCARKNAVSCALWDIAEHDIQVWAAAMAAAYPKRSYRKVKK